MGGGAQRTGADSPAHHVGVEETTSPTRLTDRYVLFGEIGQGGMARVHMGRQLGSATFSRAVAIKRLLPRFAEEPEFRLMLSDEARLAARVRHPNVVQMLDVMASDNELFLVMEYIDGVSLGRLTRKAQENGGRIPEAIVAAVICHVLHGLHAAHEATDENGAPLSIVHRDVSPDNVLVGADGLARVLDFGVAKASSRLQKTRDGEIKGKLSYMAPEQLSGRATRQSDIFSASIILWEGLVGRRLFRADDDGETIGRVLAAVVEPPRSLAPDISPALSEIVMRGLARNPAGRWATARDMALALEQGVALATASQIGAWVESMEGPWLAEQRALVRRAEAPAADTKTAPSQVTRRMDVAPFLDAAPSAGGMETDAPRSARAARSPARRRAAVWLVAIAVVATGVTALALAGRPVAHPTRAAAAVTPPSVVPIEPSTAAPSDVPAVGSVAVAPPTAAAALPTKPARVRRSSGAAAPSPAPGGRAADKPATNPCDPPYRLGPLGEKIWLKECL